MDFFKDDNNIKQALPEIDEYAIKQRIYDIQFELSAQRASGRSSRIVNDVIEEFFQKPIGTEIIVQDHYYGANHGMRNGKHYMDTSHKDYRMGHDGSNVRKASELVLRKVVRRLETEYPGVEFEISKGAYPYYIKRKSKTKREILNDELYELYKILNK